MQEEKILGLDSQEGLASPYKISVISDTHLIPEEMVYPNEDFVKSNQSDRKFYIASQGLFEEALNKIEEKGSDIIFIPGDLTKDGCYRSHQRIADLLQAWQDRGKARKVFLIPGNHDILNNKSMDFNHEGKGITVEARMTNPADFAEIFGDLIYDREDVLLYKDSQYFKDYLDQVNQAYPSRAQDPDLNYYAQGYNSYACSLDGQAYGLKEGQGLTIIGLDSSVYSIEFALDGRDGHHEVFGEITEATMSWVLEVVDEANARGDGIIVMGHHPIAPNFDSKDYILTNYIMRNWNKAYESDNPRLDGKTPVEVFIENNIFYYLTGHLHTNHISKIDRQGKSLYCIQTGSIVTHPLPMRHLKVYNGLGQGQGLRMEVENDYIESFSYTDPLTGQRTHVEDAFSYTAYDKIVDPELVANKNEYNLEKIQARGEGIRDWLEPYLDPGYAGEILSKIADKLLQKPYERKLAKGRVHIKVYEDTVKRPGPGQGDKKIAIDTTILGIIKLPLMLRADSLEKNLDSVIAQLEAKILKGEKIYDWTYRLMDGLLHTQVYEDKDFGPVTIDDLLQEALTCFLRGSDGQKPWVTGTIAKYKNGGGNIIFDALQEDSLLDPVNYIVDDFVRAVEYKLDPEDPVSEKTNKEFISNLIELDRPVKGPIYRFMINQIVNVLGNDLYDTAHNKYMKKLTGFDGDVWKFSDIVGLVLHSDFLEANKERFRELEARYVESLTGVEGKTITDVFISVLDNMTQKDYEHMNSDDADHLIIVAK